MRNTYGFEDKYSEILKRVKEVFRVYKRIDKSDVIDYVRDNTDIFVNWALSMEEYLDFIEKLEQEFNITLKNQFYDDTEGFEDLTNADYSRLDGISYYIFLKLNRVNSFT